MCYYAKLSTMTKHIPIVVVMFVMTKTNNQQELPVIGHYRISPYLTQVKTMLGFRIRNALYSSVVGNLRLGFL